MWIAVSQTASKQPILLENVFQDLIRDGAGHGGGGALCGLASYRLTQRAVILFLAGRGLRARPCDGLGDLASHTARHA